MEKITRFPILVIDKTANSSVTGLGPQLRYEIRPLSGTSDDEIVSERGIRDAICNQHYNISGDTIGIGDHIFKKIDWYPHKDTIEFNTLSGIGSITTKLSSGDDYVHFGSTLPDIYDNTSGFVYLQRTLNGGIEQETSVIVYSDFKDITEKVIFQNPKSDDVIGKILIKCNQEFNGDEVFSIGVDGDEEYFVKKFLSPLKTSIESKELVRTLYGEGLYDKVVFIDNILWKESPHKNKDIKVFRHILGGTNGFPYTFGNWFFPGNISTQGEMEIVIFYDKKIDLQDGYLLGGQLPIQGMRLETVSTFILSQSLQTEIINSAGVSSSIKGYCLGGTDKDNQSTNAIQGILFGVEASFVLNNTLKTKRDGFMNGYYTLYKGYVPGGKTDMYNYLDTIGSLNYSTETESILSTHLNKIRDNATCLQSSLRGHLIGGGISNVSTKTIEYLDFATETNYLSDNSLHNSTANTMGISTYEKGYLVGGNENGIISKRINIFDYSTQSTNQYFMELSTSLENGGCVKSEYDGFVCSGSDGNGVINTISQIEFMTNTVSVEKQTLISGIENITGVQG